MSEFYAFYESGKTESKDAKRVVQLRVVKEDKIRATVEVNGVSYSEVNELRKAMFSVPTVACEEVQVIDNESYLKEDEFVAHRIGLLPLAIDPRMMEPPPGLLVPSRDYEMTTGSGMPIAASASVLASVVTEPTEKNTIIFRIRVTGSHAPDCRFSRGPVIVESGPTGEREDRRSQGQRQSAGPWAPSAAFPRGQHVTVSKKHLCDCKITTVTSGDMRWAPFGGQTAIFVGDLAPRPLYDNIMITKLAPDCTFHALCMCHIGTGRLNAARYSPVCVAVHKPRLRIIAHPDIAIGPVALAAAAACKRGILSVSPASGRLVVDAAAADSCNRCRNCLSASDRASLTAACLTRGPNADSLLSDPIRLVESETDFLLSIESTGILSPRRIIADACDLLLVLAPSLSVRFLLAK